MQPIHIFRAGRHTAMSGASLEFSEADLAATATAYDPDLHEAPLVIGHPTHDAPAYGRVAALSAIGGDLNARPYQVEPQFAELVRAGRYNKVSASFYLPDAAANPAPGVYYLRHVGFLGAQPPAVKGLKPIEFADDASDTVTVEFGEVSGRDVATLFRSLRDWILGQFGQDVADKALPGWAVDQAMLDAATPDVKPESVSDSSPAYSEQEIDTVTEKELAERESALAAREGTFKAQEASFAEREQRIADAEALRARRAIADFVESQVVAGKVLPRDQVGLVEFMASVAADAVVEFAEGDAKVSKPAAEWLRSFIEHLPPAIDYGEHAAAEDPANTQAYDAPAGFAVNPERLALHNKALAYAEHNQVDYTVAVAAVSK